MDNDLFGEDELYFRLKSGEYDISTIARYLLNLGYSFQDEADPTMFVVCLDAESRRVFEERRRQHPEQGFPFVLLIKVQADIVTVIQSAGPDFAELSHAFVTWLVANYPISVTNDMGTDLSYMLD